MNDLLLLAPLRWEARALRRGHPRATVVVTGARRRRSERARTRLADVIDTHRATAIVGFCGATNGDLAPGDLVVADVVRDPDGREWTLPGAAMLAGELRRAGLPAVAGAVHSVEQLARGKARAAAAAAGAMAVDMESAWLADAFADDKPCAIVRAVVDTPVHELVSLHTARNAFRAARSLRAAVPVLGRWAAASRRRRVVGASPRGFCAGVERAIDVVERAIERYGPPVYVRRHIIHNTHVVADLGRRGAVFVEELDEVPDGGRVVFAAHGVAPAVRDEAQRRGLATIDATCPLVAKVHTEVRHYAAKDHQVLLIGHADHEEVQGTIGEAPGSIIVVEDLAAVDDLTVDGSRPVVYVSQTTLAVDEVTEIVSRLRQRFPAIVGPTKDDICYATQNRQDAARNLAKECDVVLVVGSASSSNSNRLVEVVRREGCAAHLLDDDSALHVEWVADADTIGITAGASAPESMVQRIITALGALGPVVVTETPPVAEHVHFTLPAEVR